MLNRSRMGWSVAGVSGVIVELTIYRHLVTYPAHVRLS